MKRIRNNFCLSCLSLNFLKMGPFRQDVVLRVQMSENLVRAESLNSVDGDLEAEYCNSVRRHFLNDMVIAYERYSTLMIASHRNGQRRIDPSVMDDRRLGAPLFEQLQCVYHPDDVTFLVQLRRLRNSIVHYNGVYSATNPLNYTFGAETYESRGKEGQEISAEFDTLMWIRGRLIETVERGNSSYFVHHPLPVASDSVMRHASVLTVGARGTGLR